VSGVPVAYARAPKRPLELAADDGRRLCQPDHARPFSSVYDVAAARGAWRPDCGGGDGGQAVPLLEHFEAERPFERPALAERVAALAAGAAGGGAAPGRRLLEQPLAGLHPASWCGPRCACRKPAAVGGCDNRRNCPCGGGARRPGAVARGAEARRGAVCLHSRTRRPKGR